MSPAKQHDVLIIGGGITGCTLAVALADRGRSVTVLERAVPGAEATSAAGGMLMPQAEAHAPGPMLDFGVAARACTFRWAERMAAEVDHDVHLQRAGMVEVALDAGEAHVLKDKLRWQTALGHDAAWLAPDALLERAPHVDPRAAGALFFEREGHLDPVRYAQAARALAAHAGVRIEAHHTVDEVVHDGTRVTGVRTTHATDGQAVHTAHDVVLAAGAWSGQIAGAGLTGAVFPVKGQMLAFALPRQPSATIVCGAGGYLIPRLDGTIVAGSTMEHAGYGKAVTGRGLSRLLEQALRTAPSLGDAAVTRTWAGLRPGTADGMPMIGRGHVQGLWVNTGHFRNGILLAAHSAERLAAAMAGEETPDLAPFSVR